MLIIMTISSKKPPCLSLLIVVLFLPLFTATIVAQPSSSPCSDQFLHQAKKFNLTNCKKLSTLGAEFGWTYHRQSTQNGSARIDIFFGVPCHETLKWIAWGVNPGKRPHMVGTRALIGFILENGTMPVKTYNVTAYTKLGCRLLPSPVEFSVRDLAGEPCSDSSRHVAIFARIELGEGVYNVSRLNHVWQVGFWADLDTLEPKMHGSALQNFDSSETIDLISSESRGVGHHRRHLRMVHGILNIVGWGTLLPIGAIVARYFKKFPVEYNHWIRIHIGCQIAGYVIGTAGWVVGISLGRASRHYTFHIHRLLAIFIFAFTTLQMLALRFRPKEHDDYRKYWDMYHHFLGYALLALIAVNMFQGIAILKPNHSWKWAYIGILCLLGLVTLGFEIYTWVKFLRKPDPNKSNKEENKSDNKENKSDNKVIKNDNKDSQGVKPPNQAS